MVKINENDADHLLKMATQLYVLAQSCENDDLNDFARRLKAAGALVSNVGSDIQLLTNTQKAN